MIKPFLKREVSYSQKVLQLVRAYWEAERKGCLALIPGHGLTVDWDVCFYIRHSVVKYFPFQLSFNLNLRKFILDS